MLPFYPNHRQCFFLYLFLNISLLSFLFHFRFQRLLRGGVEKEHFFKRIQPVQFFCPILTLLYSSFQFQRMTLLLIEEEPGKDSNLQHVLQKAVFLPLNHYLGRQSRFQPIPRDCIVCSSLSFLICSTHQWDNW